MQQTLSNQTEVTASELAGVLLIRPAYVSELVAAKKLPRAKRNTYHLIECVQAYIRHLGGERDFDGDGQKSEAEHKRELLKSRVELVREQTESHKLKNQVLRGGYIPRAEVETAFAPIMAQWLDEMRINYESEFPNWAIGHTAAEMKAEAQRRNDSIAAAIRGEKQRTLDGLEEKASGSLQAEEGNDSKPDVLKVGRKKDPNSGRSKARVQAAKGEPPKRGRRSRK